MKICLALVLWIISVAALAATPTFDAAPVPESKLDEIRGGVAFAMTRIATVNGERVADIQVRIPDVANVTRDQAAALARATSMLVIQNGPANTANLSDLATGSTLIQNTLNDQRLAVLTTMDVQTNTLGAFRELNFQEGLTHAPGALGGVR
jgi:hypothetical protein